MRRITLRFAVAILGFAIGTGAFVFSYTLDQPLPYCEVARESERYHDTTVRVRARLYFDRGAMYIYEDCDPTEALSSLVEFKDTIADPTDYSVRLDNQSHAKVADAIVEGRFNGRLSQGCYGPKYQLVATKIELTSPLEDFRVPVTDGPQLRTKH